MKIKQKRKVSSESLNDQLQNLRRSAFSKTTSGLRISAKAFMSSPIGSADPAPPPGGAITDSSTMCDIVNGSI